MGLWIGKQAFLVVDCAAHKLNPGLSSSVGLSCSGCQEKNNCCFQFVSWNLTCLHVELSLANVDKGIANSKLFRLKATLRPQNAGHKAAAAKRPPLPMAGLGLV